MAFKKKIFTENVWVRTLLQLEYAKDDFDSYNKYLTIQLKHFQATVSTQESMFNFSI